MAISLIQTSDGTLSLIVRNKQYLVPVSHPFYREIVQAIRENNEDLVISLADASQAIENYVFGNVEIKNGQVFYKDQPVHNVVTSRIVSMMKARLPYEPIVKFLNNLMENPSYRATKELFEFLSHRFLPITEDGCFLAYKSVRPDYKDWYSNTFDNSPGKVVEISRNSVDDNCANHCSDGLHVGAIEYVKTYRLDEGRAIIVKVNPRDAVSVPTDHNATKLRCCRYEVIGDYEGDLTKIVYTNAGAAISNDEDDNDENSVPYFVKEVKTYIGDDEDYEDYDEDEDEDYDDDDDDSNNDDYLTN